MASRRDTLGDFWLGLKGQFPSLEEALTHPQSERKLIALNDSSTAYNKKHHTISYWHDGEKRRIPIDPAFRDYMSKYARVTHYVTDKGTPWLTREQEGGTQIRQNQLDAYYDALCKGENREVVMLNWTNTSKKDTGHAAISVGTLSLLDGSLETDEIPLYDYTPEITGSYYGSTTPWLGTKHWDQYMKDSTVRKVGKSSPIAHATGTTLRDSAVPIATFVSGAMVALITQVQGAKSQGASQRRINAIIKGSLKTMVAATAIGATTITSGLLATSNGTFLMKEEMEGSGILATLITPAQRDIMEHSLYGIYQTYYGKYNILSSNCADFTQKMLQDIKLEIEPLIEEAMQQQRPKNFVERVKKSVSIPDQAKPNRHDWALSTRKQQVGIIELPPNPAGEQKKYDGIRSPKRVARFKSQREAEPHGEPLYVTPIDDLGQSSIWIKTTTPDRQFRQPPIETFRDVLKHALTLRQDKEGHYHFELQPHVQMKEKEAARGFDR